MWTHFIGSKTWIVLDAQIATFWERNLASRASRGMGIAFVKMVNGLNFQQKCGDGQNQKVGTTCDPLRMLCFHPGELILVHEA
jgi:hypothetical protein